MNVLERIWKELNRYMIEIMLLLLSIVIIIDVSEKKIDFTFFFLEWRRNENCRMNDL